MKESTLRTETKIKKIQIGNACAICKNKYNKRERRSNGKYIPFPRFS